MNIKDNLEVFLFGVLCGTLFTMVIALFCNIIFN